MSFACPPPFSAETTLVAMFRARPSLPGIDVSETLRYPIEFRHVADLSVASVGSPNFVLSTPIICLEEAGLTPYMRYTNRPSTKFAKMPWAPHSTNVQPLNKKSHPCERDALIDATTGLMGSTIGALCMFVVGFELIQRCARSLTLQFVRLVGCRLRCADEQECCEDESK